ncbi:hypothetical protein ASF89_06560 [Frigoribacterium sp. Leaf172]|nr:hypothetical protein ASF89_06560 [Frigoribacterium sp. Leaf172]
MSVDFPPPKTALGLADVQGLVINAGAEAERVPRGFVRPDCIEPCVGRNEHRGLHDVMPRPKELPLSMLRRGSDGF